MRSLLFHCKESSFVITGLATRPRGIIHGDILNKSQSARDCILTFVTVENGDSKEKSVKLVEEILKFCKDTGRKDVFLCPFAHLSNNLAPSKEALPVFAEISNGLKVAGVRLTEGHFGSDKEFLIHVYGHRGNTRYREF